MKTLLTSLAIASIALSATVSAKNVQLRPADDTFETKVCLAAATQGLSAAYDLIKESDENFSRFTEQLTCNGKSLIRATRTLKNATQQEVNNDKEKVKDISTDAARKVRFVTDEAAASKTCLDAVLLGAEAALKKHDMENSNIICNNIDIRKFAKKYAGKTVSL